VAPTARRQKPRPATVFPATPALPEIDADESASVAQEPRPVADEPKPAAAPAKHRAAVRVAIVKEPTPPPAPAPEIAPQPAEPSRIAVEQALLGRAMKTLRDGHDARTSLALLAQHAEQFPDGALASEATMLRIEALLALGLKNEALSVLDKVPLASLPNRDEQLVVRGELRAAKGRWREAKEDFNDALRDRSLPAASARARTIQERALWGRASARSRLGDQDGARADLDLYLRHFPGGRFAVPAASSLKGVP
jgi:tetratricopeptide (TPR) repeat protein